MHKPFTLKWWLWQWSDASGKSVNAFDDCRKADYERYVRLSVWIYDRIICKYGEALDAREIRVRRETEQIAVSAFCAPHPVDEAAGIADIAFDIDPRFIADPHILMTGEPVEIRGHMHDIPVIGTIDSATGAITHTAPLPEPLAPPAAQYAAGRMSHRARIIGALGIAAAVAIAAAVVLVERVKGRGVK
jgi:hypothetical protein